jgi:hypothetical protein
MIESDLSLLSAVFDKVKRVYAGIRRLFVIAAKLDRLTCPIIKVANPPLASRSNCQAARDGKYEDFS